MKFFPPPCTFKNSKSGGESSIEIKLKSQHCKDDHIFVIKLSKPKRRLATVLIYKMSPTPAESKYVFVHFLTVKYSLCFSIFELVYVTIQKRCHRGGASTTLVIRETKYNTSHDNTH